MMGYRPATLEDLQGLMALAIPPAQWLEFRSWALRWYGEDAYRLRVNGVSVYNDSTYDDTLHSIVVWDRAGNLLSHTRDDFPVDDEDWRPHMRALRLYRTIGAWAQMLEVLGYTSDRTPDGDDARGRICQELYLGMPVPGVGQFTFTIDMPPGLSSLFVWDPFASDAPPPVVATPRDRRLRAIAWEDGEDA